MTRFDSAETHGTSVRRLRGRSGPSGSVDRQNVVDMAGTRVDDDHLLSMYVDNELDAERTIALVSRLRSEPALRARLEASRRARKAGSLRNLLTKAMVRSASSSLSTYIDSKWSSSTRVPAMSTTF